MSQRPIGCPGCTYSGQPHLTTCMKHEDFITWPHVAGIYIPGQSNPILNIEEKQKEAHEEPASVYMPNTQPAESKEYKVDPKTDVPVEYIEQKLLPSSGTKIVCTDCGRGDWHFLMIRRKAGLLEGLCKQIDGSGCYPSASRRNCSYTSPDQIDCPQLAEYIVASGTQLLNPRHVCRDHVGEMLRQGPLYQVWPLED